MNVNFSSILYVGLDSLNEVGARLLNTQQKRVIAIALAAFALLAVYYVARHFLASKLIKAEDVTDVPASPSATPDEIYETNMKNFWGMVNRITSNNYINMEGGDITRVLRFNAQGEMIGMASEFYSRHYNGDPMYDIDSTQKRQGKVYDIRLTIHKKPFFQFSDKPESSNPTIQKAISIQTIQTAISIQLDNPKDLREFPKEVLEQIQRLEDHLNASFHLPANGS